ncbi:uncharacterized protein LOC128861985 [Anastrepha ludens]|uniref:uncharacterized protein LOC128861985 n=1 Tax=Anastrepha ludens TaxID=28586 RepID=UPI0023AE9DD4|nr:uncharacterized protein LOC128861985 [Anastrepha ludens]
MDSKKQDDIAHFALLFILLKNRKKSKKRKQWCKKWLQRRNQSSDINLLRELREEPLDFLNYLRITETVYQKLLSLDSPLIIKRDTVMRKAISPHERLTATLRFLATGRSYECLKFSTRISPQSLGKIIPETSNALYKVLRKYIQFPNSEEKWKEIASSFEERWHFPHCIGAEDEEKNGIISSCACPTIGWLNQE